MPDLLLELFSEEIPARMQEAAAKDLERLVVGALSDRGLLFEGAKSFSGPRRLTLAIPGLPAKQPDVREERKGPRVGAPEKAIEGFLRSAGVTLEQCAKQSDAKGEFYVAVIARNGRPTAEVLAEILPETIAKLPWPKSMRWPYEAWAGEAGEARGSLRWVRPLHAIVCTFDGEVAPFEFAGVKSGNVTFGHRFLSHGPIEMRRFDDYQKKLHDAHVILDAAERKARILHEAKQTAFALGLDLVEDEGLLDEVAGLAEWPVVLVGRIEDSFMDLPPEILRTSMRTHQKYFALRDPKTGKLANRFAVVSNMIGRDGGKEIVAGNERVLRARLSDAKFFWDQDRKRTLESRVDDLKKVVFHAKLGTQYERVERIEALAGDIAAKVGAVPARAKRAARLCKADLTVGVVGEFPELQGVVGSYYALNDGEDSDIADAIRDHYKPVGPNDEVPTARVTVAVALADKLDLLSQFFFIDERPTGSGDPYGLRRAALGVIKQVLGTRSRLPLTPIFAASIGAKIIAAVHARREDVIGAMAHASKVADIDLKPEMFQSFFDVAIEPKERVMIMGAIKRLAVTRKQLLAFFSDRLKVALRDRGIRYDLIDAVFSLGIEDDLVRLIDRVMALQTFLKTDDGTNLLVAYRRAANILKAEEKKDKVAYDGAPDAKLLAVSEEKALAAALTEAEPRIASEIKAEHFVEAMGVMAKLRAPVDAFFEKVTVNAPEPELRRNRLLLLSRLRSTLHLVADFSKIEG